MTRAENLQWWQEARLGMFIHWGLYSIPARGEWVMYNERIPVREYEKLAHQFNPVRFDASEWVRLAKSAGMKYIVLTAKHHDGFSLFKSDVSAFNAVDGTPFGRDIVGELAEACKKGGLRLGLYYSHVREWRDPRAQSFEAKGRPDLWGNYGNFWDYPNENRKNLQEYIDRFDMPQLRELLTRYGDILTIWFDTPSHIRPGQAESLRELVRTLQPGCLVNSRLSYDIETDYHSMGDNEIPAAPISAPWESAMTTSCSWGYRKGAPCIDWTDMVRRLSDTASRGGNLLLNVGPDALGEIPMDVQQELLMLGKWLRQYGEAIYQTQPSPFAYEPAWGRITRRGNTLYLIVTDAGARSVTLRGLAGGILSCRDLATGKELKTSQTGRPEHGCRRIEIVLERSSDPFRVIALETDGIRIENRQEADERGDVHLPAFRAEVIGAHGLRVSPSGVTEGWTDTRDRLRWQFFTENAGKYRLELILKTGFWKIWDWGHELDIELDHDIYSASVEDDGIPTGRWGEKCLTLTDVFLGAGRHVLTAAPQLLTGDNMAGLTLAAVRLKKL